MNVFKTFRAIRRRLSYTRSLADLDGQITAIDRSQAVVELGLDGTILSANRNFCDLLGYSRKQLIGQNHRILVTVEARSGREYAAFWESLARGEFQSGVYKRLTRDAQERWMRASYNPIIGSDGKPFKVVKYACDVTEERLRTADLDGQIAALHKSQLVAEFDLDGKLLDANDNFLRIFGYRLSELLGTHHSRLVEPAERDSDAYRAFWKKMACGEAHTGVYHRVAKGGRIVWLQATYNPILDMQGRPFKVVQYASDITARIMATRTLQTAVTGLSAALTASASDAREATMMAIDASNVALRGGQVMDEVVESMREMKRSAQTISDIVTVIDDIAFQTNLLALNAAIEASWAGEQAHGFAAMAGEVRSLAQRSAESAKEVRSLIGASVERVGSSVELAAIAGATMNEIMHSVERVTDKVGRIRSVSLMQSPDIDAIHEAVAQLERQPSSNLDVA